MHPVLFNLFNFPVRAYGVLLVIGVVVAVQLARKRALRFGVKPESIWDSAFWLVIPGILGARIVFILQNLSFYRLHPEQLWSLRFEGLTSFGGLLFGFLGFLVWRKKSGTPLWPYLDTIGVPVLVAQAIGRIGCLMNGCCYGRPTNEWYGVQFEHLAGKHVPAQLIDTFLMLAGALAMVVWERKSSLKPGASFGVFLVAYGFSRFVYEFFRAGTEGETVSQVASSAYVRGLPITSAQVVCLLLVLVGLAVTVAASRRPALQSVTSST